MSTFYDIVCKSFSFFLDNFVPVCWQIREEQHLWVHLHSTFCLILPLLLLLVHDRCYPQRILDLNKTYNNAYLPIRKHELLNAKCKASQRNNGRKLYFTTLSVLEVVSPKWSNFVLASDIPHCKTNVLVFNCFYVKSCKQKLTNVLHDWYNNMIRGITPEE